MNDIDLLRYALTLEHLEDKFYREGLGRSTARWSRREISRIYAECLSLLANFTETDFSTAGFDSNFYGTYNYEY